MPLIQTLFEPVRAWSFGRVAIIPSRDLRMLLKRLQNAEVGFDYAVRREIPRLQMSRDAHMLNAQKLREQLIASVDGRRMAETPKSGSVRSTTSAVAATSGETPNPGPSS